MRSVGEELINLMRALNIPEEYLEKEWDEKEEIEREKKEQERICLNCQGVSKCPSGGFLKRYIEEDGRFEKYYKKCSKRILLEGKMPILYEDKDLENFEVGQNKKIIERVKEYLRNKEYSKGKGLIFVGECGVGKTHLAVGIMKELAKKGIQVKFVFVPDFLDELRKSYEKEAGLEEDIIGVVRDCDFLILDDLGTEKITEWSKEKILQVINHRVNYLLPFIITTNFSGEVLKERIGERTYSRIKGVCEELVLNGSDRRLSK